MSFYSFILNPHLFYSILLWLQEEAILGAEKQILTNVLHFSLSNTKVFYVGTHLAWPCIHYKRQRQRYSYFFKPLWSQMHFLNFNISFPFLPGSVTGPLPPWTTKSNTAFLSSCRMGCFLACFGFHKRRKKRRSPADGVTIADQVRDSSLSLFPSSVSMYVNSVLLFDGSLCYLNPLADTSKLWAFRFLSGYNLWHYWQTRDSEF